MGDAVADFGAGTGILTQQLIQRGYTVTAIEPNQQMLQRAQAPGARWLEGSFEDSHLADASQRWAVAAQAFHWADPVRALPEIRRVLEPGRLFTVLWNNRDPSRSEILAWTEKAMQHQVPGYKERYRSLHNSDWGPVLESTGDFTLCEHRVIDHTISMSRQRYLDLWRSHHFFNHAAGPERFAAFLKELGEDLLRGRIESVDVPYRCVSWSARRND